jgi:hypothetical protein
LSKLVNDLLDVGLEVGQESIGSRRILRKLVLDDQDGILDILNNILDPSLWGQITKKYIDLAIKIDNYQEEIWKAWDEGVANRARDLVTLPIIKETGCEYKKYKVNIENDLTVLIKEVK